MVKQKTLFSFFQKKETNIDQKQVYINVTAPTIIPEQPPSAKGEVPSSGIDLPQAGDFTYNSKVGEETKDVREKLCSSGEEIDRTHLDNNEVKQTFVSDEDEESTSKDASRQYQDISSSDCISENDYDANDNNHHHLSDYEKLRLRNIKRNHDRLAALGLIDSSKNNNAMLKSTSDERQDSSTRRQSKKRKKPDRVKHTAPTMPLRRSSRNRNVPSLNSINNAEQGEEVPHSQTAMERKEEEEAELFRDSPLVQYSMQLDESSKNPFQTFAFQQRSLGKLSSFVPTGPRLLSPKSNHAIYSLDIFATEDNSAVEWIVCAGKSGLVSIWNCANKAETEGDDDGLEPVITWKSHGGRWVSDAIFVPVKGDLNSSNVTTNTINHPSHLLTAANDGKVCLWDVRSISCSTGAPKNLATTGSSLHAGGIFSMHVVGGNYSDVMVCTGSKDKTLAVSTLDSIVGGGGGGPIFVSHHHNAKVGCVQMQGQGGALIGSASDDGSIAVHDFRSRNTIADIDFAHDRPHSFVWDSSNLHTFFSAGLDTTIHSWDLRILKGPVESYYGHVPLTTKKCKRIHRPCIYRSELGLDYLLSGSENSGCLSIFQVSKEREEDVCKELHKSPVYSRGYLPDDCGDAGCIGVHGSNVVVTVDGGDVLILEPRSSSE